ncbi:Small G protein signaling modulator 1, partial [Lamellibrachia satsuma]
NEKEKLIGAVKKEVKQIMEEAVTRKFVHEESSSITSLCAIVEECLHNGLKKRALGLFKNSTTMALLQKVSKSFEPAAHIVKLVSDIENNQENKLFVCRKSFDSNRNLSLRTGWTGTSVNPRYLWIRLALFEKDLAEIIEYLVQSAHKYYE